MLLGHPSLDIYDICRIRKYSDSKSCFISWICRHHLTTSPRFSSISAIAKEGKGWKYCGFCCCAAALAGMSRPSDPKKWKDIDVSKGTRWKICLAALQVVFKNVCYFLKNLLQNQKLSVAVMSVSTSECPDDPEGNNCGKAISTKQSIALYIWRFL